MTAVKNPSLSSPRYICRLQRDEPGSCDALRDQICGLRGINWDSPWAKIALWMLRRA